MLAERSGQVVAREALLDRIWPGVVVADESLSRCIYELRRQLAPAAGDEQNYKEVIETLPKRGYRLNGEVTLVAAAGASSGGSTRRRRTAWVLAGFVVAILAVIAWRGMHLTQPDSARSNTAGYSLAVLPFDDMSETQDQAYLADGVAEEILDKLNQSKDLRVIARTSSFMFRGSRLDIKEIARKLKVSHILEGSIRKSGDFRRADRSLGS